MKENKIISVGRKNYLGMSDAITLILAEAGKALGIERPLNLLCFVAPVDGTGLSA